MTLLDSAFEPSAINQLASLALAAIGCWLLALAFVNRRKP